MRIEEYEMQSVNEKAKLGLSVCVMAAAVYFLMLINTLAGVAVAGYILLCEENEWLKKSAVKAVTIVIVFGMFNALLSVLDDGFGMINAIFGNFGNFRLGLPLNLDDFLFDTISLARTLVLLLSGWMALSHNDMKISILDSVYSSVLSEQPVPAANAPQPPVSSGYSNAPQQPAPAGYTNAQPGPAAPQQPGDYTNVPQQPSVDYTNHQ